MSWLWGESSILMANSSRPIIKLFERFAKSWGSIDKDGYKSDDWRVDCCTAWSFQRRLGQFSFVQGNLTNFHARDDYKELLGLALIFSGVPPVDERTSLLLELSTEHGGGWQSWSIVLKIPPLFSVSSDCVWAAKPLWVQCICSSGYLKAW